MDRDIRVLRDAIDAYYTAGGSPTCLSMTIEAQVAAALAHSKEFDAALRYYDHIITAFPIFATATQLNCFRKFTEELIRDEGRNEEVPWEGNTLGSWLNAYY